MATPRKNITVEEFTSFVASTKDVFIALQDGVAAAAAEIEALKAENQALRERLDRSALWAGKVNRKLRTIK